jgi:hypothetical protein
LMARPPMFWLMGGVLPIRTNAASDASVSAALLRRQWRAKLLTSYQKSL